MVDEGWYLQHIEVQPPDGEKLLFPCNAWLGQSDCGGYDGARMHAAPQPCKRARALLALVMPATPGPLPTRPPLRPMPPQPRTLLRAHTRALLQAPTSATCCWPSTRS